MSQSCPWTWLQSIYAPVGTNAFNPCFLGRVFIAVSILMVPWLLHDLLKSLRDQRYGTYSMKSSGFAHFVRLAGVITYLVILFIQLDVISPPFDLGSIASLVISIVSAFVVLPLHTIETGCVTIPHSSLLVFWPIQILIQITSAFQIHQKWPVFQFLTHLSYVLILIPIMIVVFESTPLWKPTHELRTAFVAGGKSDQLNRPHLYSQVTFTWLNPMVRNVYVNNTLKAEDLPSTANELTAECFRNRLLQYWNPEGVQKNRSTRVLGFALFRAFGPTVLMSCLIELFMSIIQFIQPQLLRQLILFFGKVNQDGLENSNVLQGFMICISVFILSVTITIAMSSYILYNMNAGFGAQTSTATLIYEKSMRLLFESRSLYPTGDIINLVTVDVSKIQSITQNIQTLIIAPLDFIICLTSIWMLLGKLTLAAIFIIIVMIPLNSFVVKLSKRLRKTQMKYKDARSRMINEILTTIKSIKLYAWEEPMNERLQEVRENQELKNLARIRKVSVVSNFIWRIVPFMISFATFSTFALTQDIPLTLDIVFPALSLLGMLSNPLTELPSIITALADALVSLERIAHFLVASEVDFNQVIAYPNKANPGDPAVKISNTSFLWTPFKISNNEDEMASPQHALINIDFVTNKGELHCLVGKVGAGKSAFLTSIMGKLYAVPGNGKEEPRIEVHGLLAYCSQSPWILNSTLKDNILFGHEYDEEFYQQTIEACQLLPDLEILPDGDNTFVGEKGITLLGGQKSRLALARAVYSRADVYLLDDVLLAVDSHVAKMITEKVLSRSTGLLKTKTIVLATNSLLVLPFSNNVSMLQNGRLIETGTYKEAQINHPNLAQLLNEFGRNGLAATPTDVDKTENYDKIDNIDISNASSLIESSDATAVSEEELISDINSILPASVAPFQWKSLSDLTNSRTKQELEKQELGGVKWRVYWEYVKASLVLGSIVWIILLILMHISSIGGNVWLKHWAEKNGASGENADAIKYVGIYALFGMFYAMMGVFGNYLFSVYLGIRASKVIHARMATSMFRSPMSFFERTPIGRIMNRFTSDISKVDDSIPGIFTRFFGRLFSTIATILVISVVIPLYNIVVVLLLVAYFYYYRFFSLVARELKRLVLILRLPIYAHFQESLNGVDTIRAFRQIERFRFLNDANFDFYMHSIYILRLLNRWLRMRLGFIGALASLSASTLLVGTLFTKHPLSAGTAGFIMTYALQVTNLLAMIVRLRSEVEQTIVAYERCLEYSELIEEEPKDGEYLKLPESFPQRGEIEFRNYSTRYRANLDLILKNISFTIKPQEKIGVVGRTGAGKSSLSLALFRVIEAVEGGIFIDGIDTSKLSVYDLRRHLNIIPQDSQAISGTIRQNLDPLGRHSDEELWDALELSHLKQHISTLSESDQLSYAVADGGLNFSSGQLQLMCLARALLNPSKIIVLDEATAAVDVQTDKVVQETIRRNFLDRTIITIAHRLDTVMDSDRILTLHRGEICDFDTPTALLADKKSIFYELCKQGGYIEG